MSNSFLKVRAERKDFLFHNSSEEHMEKRGWVTREEGVWQGKEGAFWCVCAGLGAKGHMAGARSSDVPKVGNTVQLQLESLIFVEDVTYRRDPTAKLTRQRRQTLPLFHRERTVRRGPPSDDGMFFFYNQCLTRRCWKVTSVRKVECRKGLRRTNTPTLCSTVRLSSWTSQATARRSSADQLLG